MNRHEKQQMLDKLLKKHKAEGLTQAEKLELHLLLNTKVRDDNDNRDYYVPKVEYLH